ncbi:MAG: protein adenylyltransferase SelO [Methylococcales bacterium]
MDTAAKKTHLDQLVFDNRFLRELPADPESSNDRRQVFAACYSRVLPTPVTQPKTIAYAKEVADLLDLHEDVCKSSEFAEVFSGNRLSVGMDAYAMCYGGHQFGNWAGQLGDGRAINLGEVTNHKGQYWTLQLKGAGPTPYSRNADGLAVLRSSVREFLCSEAMHHLGIPTTRALSLILTGEEVIRDMFYNGNPQLEPGAIVCRVAPSFTRFGSFQIFTARQDIDLLRKLVDFTIRTDFPELGEPSVATYIQWFSEICRRTAEMIVHWQRVGFVHGVMNTDNMSILGLTIDYGPYGWLEGYDPQWTPNTTDAEERRYCFGNQPQMAFWNLGQLANALYPLIEQVQPLQEAMNVYKKTFEQGWQDMMAAKLGLITFQQGTDNDLCTELLYLLQLLETDMSIFFRKLALLDISKQSDSAAEHDKLIAPLLDAYYQPEQLNAENTALIATWLKKYSARVAQEQGSSAEAQQDRRNRMNAVNPKYVLRNYMAQQAIDAAAQGDFSMVNDLLGLLRHPYDEQPDNEKYAVKRPEWARQRAGCSMLSCSS